MKAFSCFLLALSFWVEGTTNTFGRVFTSRDGREITAEVAGVSGAEVDLVVNGRNYTVPLDSLSASDQEYVREWAKANKTYAFVYLADEVQDLSKRSVTRDKMSKTELASWNYAVRITNRTRENLENLIVKYNVVIRQTTDHDGAKNESSETQSGSVVIPTLKPGHPFSFATIATELSSKEWEVPKTVFVNKNGKPVEVTVLAEHSDVHILDGVWIKIYLGERMIGEWKSEGKMIKDAQWSETSTTTARSTQ